MSNITLESLSNILISGNIFHDNVYLLIAPKYFHFAFFIHLYYTIYTVPVDFWIDYGYSISRTFVCTVSGGCDDDRRIKEKKR